MNSSEVERAKQGNKESSVKIAFALRNEKAIHISQIKQSERGTKCNCTCPLCNGKLVARLGNVNQHHFAHSNSNALWSVCVADYVNQTVIHRMAASVLSHKGTTFYVPSVPAVTFDDVLKKYSESFNEIIKRHPNVYLNFPYDIDFPQNFSDIICGVELPSEELEVSCESLLDSYVTDLVVRYPKKEKMFLITITISLSPDSKRLREQKIRAALKKGFNLLEIDFTSYADTVITEKLLLTAFRSGDNKKWLNNCKFNEEIQKAGDQCKLKLEKYFKEKEERNNRIKNECKQQQKCRSHPYTTPFSTNSTVIKNQSRDYSNNDKKYRCQGCGSLLFEYQFSEFHKDKNTGLCNDCMIKKYTHT